MGTLAASLARGSSISFVEHWRGHALLSHTIFYALAQVHLREFSRRLLAFKLVSIRLEFVVPAIPRKDAIANTILHIHENHPACSHWALIEHPRHPVRDRAVRVWTSLS